MLWLHLSDRVTIACAVPKGTKYQNRPKDAHIDDQDMESCQA
ncbi:hypothetical protein SJ05684_b54550 (plasmid) [Sinorhizobium sojae CCBAU 05684]|uniref:Uncharacterized protein n=1 Tax=Sinorhizobium sojae CCBAU 05684 TaxID=716928 RepID=A0A249PL18_9HYPH|nr:hypothetical protein SJ05684_b54550 [Sinorhizobium sojae CCBAU 05684]